MRIHRSQRRRADRRVRRGSVVAVVALVAAAAVSLVAVTHHRETVPATAPSPVSPAQTASAPATPQPTPATSTSATSTPATSTSATSKPTPSASASTATRAATSTEHDAALADRLASLSADLGSTGLSVAAVNLTTGASFADGATSGMTEGSIAKLDILETLLLQEQARSAMLPADEQKLATTMIENSDNDAANSLWTTEGAAPAVATANQTLGLHHTVLGSGIYWGLSTTSATDQLTLLHNLVATDGPLDAASQRYVLGLMRSVESDQRWGVGVVADPGSDFANKNGWLAVDSDDDLWLTNSLGVLTVDHDTVLMAVLSQHNDSFDDGIALDEKAAQAIAATIAP